MPPATLEALETIDPAALANPVRRSQRDPAFEIVDWTVQPLTHEKIIDTTGGLFLFRGMGRSGGEPTPWAIVLKILNHPEWDSQDPQNWAYWKRELLAFQSGTLESLPGAIRAPRCYGTVEREENAWIWMEQIQESAGRRWAPDDFHRVARHAGRFAAAFLDGAPVPEAPWLSAPFFRSTMRNGDWWDSYMSPASPENAWQSPLVQGAFSDTLREKVLRIWAEKETFFDALDRLPQVFCHNDFHRRNLMFHTREPGQEELVAVDWAFCGPGAVGMDLGELVANSGFFCEYEAEQFGEIEATVLEGYMDGLRDGGWSGDARLARLGYLISATLYMGATFPGWAASMLPENSGFNVQAMYGQPAEEVLKGWAWLTEFLMDRADEARSLMCQLKVG